MLLYTQNFNLSSKIFLIAILKQKIYNSAYEKERQTILGNKKNK